MSEPYNETHQTRSRPNTPFEDLLGDSLERAFGAGKYDLLDGRLRLEALKQLERKVAPC